MDYARAICILCYNFTILRRCRTIAGEGGALSAFIGILRPHPLTYSFLLNLSPFVPLPLGISEGKGELNKEGLRPSYTPRREVEQKTAG